MNLYRYTMVGMAAIGMLFPGCTSPKDISEKEFERPNIIYILADDLGYGELGVYGQEKIETPNIDALARSGMKFTQHYSGAPVCAPSRCVLMTGQHSGHAFVRGNDEWGERGKVWDYQAMFENPFLEGQRPLPDSIITIAEILQDAGYKTGTVGKWGLGAPTTEGVPNKQGFDFFYGYNCQRQAHTYYPMHLWHNEERVMLDNKFVPLHANLAEGANPKDPKSYEEFNLHDYAPELMHREALEFMEQIVDQPFFLYYASPIPHLPLQAPQRWVDYYREKFGPEEPYTGPSYFPNLTPNATYAGMISYLDEQVGELVAKLRDMGEYENTLIIFTSDNGPSYVGGMDTEYFNSAGPFLEKYGYTKGFTHEGGIRVPMIASWPGRIAAGSSTDHISAFYDVMPTVCEILGIPTPHQSDGISFLPVMMGKTQPTHAHLYWEFPEYEGQQAVRIDSWKGIRNKIQQGNLDIELYDLQTDIKEQNNIADNHREVVKKIRGIMEKEHEPAILDKFKMEALGDVKTGYLEARKRAEKLSPTPDKITLEDGYFIISKRTALAGENLSPSAISLLQNRLQKTGTYQLQRSINKQKNVLQLQKDNSISGDGYSLYINPDQITIAANKEAGFNNGVQTLLSLMDEKIKEDKEMHDPVWTVAAVRVESER